MAFKAHHALAVVAAVILRSAGPGSAAESLVPARTGQTVKRVRGDIHITQPTAWSNTHYIIDGSLFIDEGGVLEVDNCTVELDCGYSREYEIRWRGGRMVSRDSTLGGTLKDGIIQTMNFELEWGHWISTNTTIRNTYGIVMGWSDKPVRFDATRLIQGPQCDSLIMSGKGSATIRDSTYNISLSADVTRGGKGFFDLPVNNPLNRRFNSNNIPGAMYTLELVNTKVPLWFLFVNGVSSKGPQASIELRNCPFLIPSILGSDLRGEMQLPVPWPAKGSSARTLQTGNVVWTAPEDNVRLFCWGVYLSGRRTDLTITGKTLLCELMVFDGRCSVIGSPDNWDTATTATTVEVGKNEPPTSAQLELRNVKIGRFGKNDSVKGQLTAHGNSTITISNALCADTILVTRGKGRIHASGLKQEGQIIPREQGGPITISR